MALQHPVPDELLKHIGDITVSFALLESCLQQLTWSLLGANGEMGQIITAELSFKALRALTVSVYLRRYGKDEHFANFEKLIKRAVAIEERRNQVTHSLWGAGDNASSVTRMKTTAKENHGFKFQSENVTGSGLAEIAREIKVLADDIQRFLLGYITLRIT